MATKSLQRSRKELEKRGYKTWIVEKPYNRFSHKREDLYNFGDLVGIRLDCLGVIAIQACGPDAAKHITKILEGYVDNRAERIGPNPYLSIWLKAGNRFFIWSWRLRKHKGTKDTWQLREIEFVLNNGIVEAHEIESPKVP